MITVYYFINTKNGHTLRVSLKDTSSPRILLEDLSVVPHDVHERYPWTLLLQSIMSGEFVPTNRPDR